MATRPEQLAEVLNKGLAPVYLVSGDDTLLVTEACDQPAGYVTNSEDCDDDHSTAYPGGTEISWNDIDEDCDGLDYTLDSCVEEAINMTAEEMTSTYWAIDEYEGTYYETVTGLGLPVANWLIDNQYIYLVETSTTFDASDNAIYSLNFQVDVGMNDSSYSGKIFKAGEEPLVGIIKYINKELESKGLKEGDTISFEPDSEYAFQVDGEKLYRMFTSNIKLKL